ncbi:RNA ligase family protein [bacterium]|nr:RNA ligase family protein [bacterium]
MLYKYPRTPHLYWSEGATNDDKILKSTENFEGKRVVITEKLDGEQTNLSHERIYARSIDSKDHPSRHWIKANFSYMTKFINPLHRICGENVFAQHSIAYENLDSYFYAFSVWRKDYCLNWNTTKNYLFKLHIKPVPILYDGIWNEKICRNLMQESTEKGLMEGYVVRLASGFKLEDFGISVAKFVRKDHVQTDEHWMYKPMIVNKLREYYGKN